jgi:hypothetical protein
VPEGGSGEGSGVRGKVSGNVKAKSETYDSLKVQVGGGYGVRKRRGGTAMSDAMYSLQLSTNIGRLNARVFGKNQNIRTIRRIAIALVVVYKHAGFGTWVRRPARVEYIFIFVLPEYHGWMEPF